jgi:hypothetical protein
MLSYRERRFRLMWAAGVSVGDIAAAMDRDDSTISKWRRRLGLPARQPVNVPWEAEDDAFVLTWYRRRSQRWIGQSLPSGRKVSRHAVIGRYHRLKKRKTCTQAERQQVVAAAPG